MNFTQTIPGFASLRLFFAALLLFAASVATNAQNNGEFTLDQSPLPAPTSPVMDYVGVLDANIKSNIEKKIIAFRDSTNPKVELAVAIVKTTGDRPIDMYSLAVARGWKIGSKVDDNPSALLFIAIDDRKAFTQVSRDLEDELPDSLTGQIQRQYLVPAFRQSNYSKGVNDTIDAYIRTITEKQGGLVQPTPAERRQQGRESGTSFCGLVVCLIVIFIILAIIFGRGGRGGGGGRNNDRWRGGGFGGGGGSGALPFIVGTILGNALGGGSSVGSSSDSSWGSSSGGGDSWGGFGGGGDFGGGGAGADW